MVSFQIKCGSIVAQVLQKVKGLKGRMDSGSAEGKRKGRRMELAGKLTNQVVVMFLLLATGMLL